MHHWCVLSAKKPLTDLPTGFVSGGFHLCVGYYRLNYLKDFQSLSLKGNFPNKFAFRILEAFRGLLAIALLVLILTFKQSGFLGFLPNATLEQTLGSIIPIIGCGIGILCGLGAMFSLPEENKRLALLLAFETVATTMSWYAIYFGGVIAEDQLTSLLPIIALVLRMFSTHMKTLISCIVALYQLSYFALIAFAFDLPKKLKQSRASKIVPAISKSEMTNSKY